MMNRFFTLLLAASCLTAVGQSEYCLDGPFVVCASIDPEGFDFYGDGFVSDPRKPLP